MSRKWSWSSLAGCAVARPCPYRSLRVRFVLRGTQTSGHLTTGNAKFYKDQLQEILQKTPRKAM
jgi:hypothetical protein